MTRAPQPGDQALPDGAVTPICDECRPCCTCGGNHRRDPLQGLADAITSTNLADLLDGTP